MEKLPVELLRLVYDYCDPASVRHLRVQNNVLADVGYEYLLPPNFTSLSYRNDIDQLHDVALHPRLRGSIESVTINLADIDDEYVKQIADFQSFSRLPKERQAAISSARENFSKIKTGRKSLQRFSTRIDDLREAFSNLPNLQEVDITFTQCPFENEVLRDAFQNSRKMDRALACANLDTMILALHGVRLSSFSIDRFPLEMFRLPNQRRHWFTHAQSFDSLSRLCLTLDPSGLQGPSAVFKAVNGLGHLLQLASQIRQLKIAFHPYSSSGSKFALSFRESLNGFVFTKLEDLTLEGVSCDEEDLKYFLMRHGGTLVRLRLGGRGLAHASEVSRGGIHLHEGTFKALFTGLHGKMHRLQRLHLEGIFECEQHGLPSHETYNFYPLTDESWQDVSCPSWVRASRQLINGSRFEQFVKDGGLYPGNSLAQYHY